MALLSYDERDYGRKHALLHLEAESKMQRKLTAIFRKYAGEVYSSYRSLGIPLFPTETQELLNKTLLSEYNRTAGFYSDFHAEYLTVPFVNEGRAMLAIDRRLEDILPQLALTQSDRILRTTERELTRSVEKAKEASPGVQSRMLEATYVHGQLLNRSVPRAKVISATEVTRVSEITKEVEIQETVGHLEPEELQQAFGEELDDQQMSTALVIGGAAALSAGILTSVRTWNPVLDGDTRIGHAAASGQTATQKETFDVGGEELSFPGDPRGSAANTINCRCFLTYSI